MIKYLKNIARNNGKIASLSWSIRGLWGDTPFSVNERYYKPRTRHIIDEYLNKTGVKKLHIGSQGNVLEDWLNVDIYTAFSNNVAYMDATKKFPFSNETFDYVFSEHMIEHVDFQEASHMISECYRVLNRGGKIRIATPGLDKLLTMNLESSDVKKYFEEVIKPYYLIKNIHATLESSFIVNYITYNFGHKFIYSTESLKYLLELNNFKVVGIYNPHYSDDPCFIKIEGHARSSHPLCDLETINIEAVKV